MASSSFQRESSCVFYGDDYEEAQASSCDLDAGATATATCTTATLQPPQQQQPPYNHDFAACRQATEEEGDAELRAMALRAQSNLIRQDAEQRALEWADEQQRGIAASLPSEVRLLSLLAEARRYELTRIDRAINATEPASDERFRLSQLRDDTYAAYSALFRDARTTLRQAKARQPNATLLFAASTQGIQLFSGLLPYSDGVAGAQRAVHNLRPRGLAEELLGETGQRAPATRDAIPKGAVVGSSGVLLPVSLGAMPASKGDAIAQHRRAVLASLRNRRSMLRCGSSGASQSAHAMIGIGAVPYRRSASTAAGF